METGWSGFPTENGERLGTTSQGPSNSGKPISLSRKGSGGKGQSAERFEDVYGELDSAFLNSLTPGERAWDISRALRETKVDKLRDNRSHYQFREHIVKKSTRHICTIPRNGTQAWELDTYPPEDHVSSTVGSRPVRGGMMRMIIVETCRP